MNECGLFYFLYSIAVQVALIAQYAIRDLKHLSCARMLNTEHLLNALERASDTSTKHRGGMMNAMGMLECHHVTRRLTN
jgi:hypothetical protein